MSTTIKITLIAVAVLILQSCNMAKHYGNMRINHSKEEITEHVTNNKPVNETDQTPQDNKPAAVCDGIPSLEVELAKTDSVSETPIDQQNTKPTKTTTKKEVSVLKPVKNLTCKVRSIIKPKLKLRKPGASHKEMTIDDWGYLAIGLTVVAFIVLIIVTGSFLAALLIAVQFFLALMSLIACGAILYGCWAVLNFLGGGFA